MRVWCVLVDYCFIINVIIINIRRIYIVQFTHRTVHTYRCPRQPEKFLAVLLISIWVTSIGQSSLSALSTLAFFLLLSPKMCTLKEENRNMRYLSDYYNLSY